MCSLPLTRLTSSFTIEANFLAQIPGKTVDIFKIVSSAILLATCRSRVDVDKGRFVKLAINHEITQLIGEDGSCSAELDNYDGCIYDLLYNMTMDEVGCTIPWLPGDK